jgi:hypothetical protein
VSETPHHADAPRTAGRRSGGEIERRLDVNDPTYGDNPTPTHGRETVDEATGAVYGAGVSIPRLLSLDHVHVSLARSQS